MGDLAIQRDPVKHIVTPYTTEKEVATFLVDMWSMNLLPLDTIGPFIKRTDPKLWREYTGEEISTATSNPIVETKVPQTPVVGGSLFGSSFGVKSSVLQSTVSSTAKSSVDTAAAAEPAKPVHQEDVEMDTTLNWDSLNFTPKSRIKIRQSILKSLEKAEHLRWFMDELPTSKQYPYLCLREGALTHTPVLIQILKRTNVIMF